MSKRILQQDNRPVFLKILSPFTGDITGGWEILKETPGLPILETSELCKRGGDDDDDDDAKYIVWKTDLIYSPSDEEDKEKVINVLPSSGKIHKLNRIKKILHLLNWIIFMVNLDQNDINNSKENLTQFTTNPKHS